MNLCSNSVREEICNLLCACPALCADDGYDAEGGYCTEDSVCGCGDLVVKRRFLREEKQRGFWTGEIDFGAGYADDTESFGGRRS